VPDQIEITTQQGQKRVAVAATATFVVGSGADAEVRVVAAGVAGHHLRFVRTERTWRVEPVRAGGTVEVNGTSLFCKDLNHGDCIDLVAGVRLRWLAAAADGVPQVAAAVPRRHAAPAPGPVVPPRSRPARSPRSKREGTARAARQGPIPTGILLLLLMLVVGIVGVFVVRALTNTTWPSSPAHYVDLARSQLTNHEPQRALDTLAFALREATGSVRQDALQLEAEIRRVLVEAADTPKLMQARQESDQLSAFFSRDFAAGANRPASREFVRACDQWLAAHGELCARLPEGRPLHEAMQQQRQRHVEAAALHEADTAADVVFAATARASRRRQYQAALQLLDEFAARQPGDPTLATAREKILAEGTAWLRGKLATIDAMIARGDHDRAEQEVMRLERADLLPEWAREVAARRQQLPARR
jgi:hypothetical protein